MLENFQPTVLRVFGGLCTFIDRIGLALGLSPDCRNVRFAPGVIASRDGYKVVLADNSGEVFTGMAQLVDADGDRFNLLVGGGGTLRVEHPEGTLATLYSSIPTGSSITSSSVFSRQYLCFTDGKFGSMPMMRYDGTTLSVVGCGAPGSGGTLGDGGSVEDNIGGGGMPAGSDAWGLPKGTYSTVVVFVNKHGDTSGWSPIETWENTASDNRWLLLSNIPTGPPDTARRIIGVTPPNDSSRFVYLTKTILNDNTTREKLLDVSENELLTAQLSVNRWLTSYVPWLPAGVVANQERLLVWGARATLQPGIRYTRGSGLENYGFRNLTFDGGFYSSSGAMCPQGWTYGSTSAESGGGIGGGDRITDADNGDPFYGKCYRMRGSSSDRACVAYQNRIPNDPSYIASGRRYGICALLRASSDSVTATVRVTLTNAENNNTILQADFRPSTAAGFSGMNWVEMRQEMTQPVSVGYNSLSISVGTPIPYNVKDGQWIDVRLGLYDADDYQHLHTMYVSDSGMPGTFVGETGVVSVGPDDGEGIRSIFRLRDNLFVSKERSLYALTSTAYGEPSTWSVNQVDPYAGSPSANGIAIGNGFALIASRDGLYMFDGASARLMSREIEDVWRSADWSIGERTIVLLDPAMEVVRVVLPTSADSGADVSRRGASLVLALDYKEGWQSPVPSGVGMHWSRDEFYRHPSESLYTVRFPAGGMWLNEHGVRVPMLSAYGSLVENKADWSRDFGRSPDGKWTFFGSLNVSSPSSPVNGQLPNAYGEAAAWRWSVYGGFSGYATRTVSTTSGKTPVVSFYVNPVVTAKSFTVSMLGVSFTQIAEPGRWTRIVAPLYGAITTGNDTLTLTVSHILNAGDWWLYISDLQVTCVNEPSDFGIHDPYVSSVPVYGGIVVSPTSGERNDFSGRIRFRYETATFGSEVGRSTFDRCIIRAIGNGQLAAKYSGLSSREWEMIPVQLVEDPEEDVEYGADLKAPAASLVLTNDSYGAWAVIKRIAVASSSQLAGWLRGRNG